MSLEEDDDMTSLQHYSSLLSSLLNDLDHLPWKRASRNSSTFSIPYKTLLTFLDRNDLVRALNRNGHERLKTKIKKLLRESSEIFREQLRDEVEGNRLQLIPVLKFYQHCRGTKRNRPAAPESMENNDLPPVVKQKSAPQNSLSLKLESIPGASFNVMMSPEFSDGKSMQGWLYDKLMEERRQTLSDEQVGSWLLQACGGGGVPTPTIVTKLLRLACDCAQRPKLLVFDPTQLCYPYPFFLRHCGSQSVSRERLASLLVLYWDKLKQESSHAWENLTKEEVLFDIAVHGHDFSANEWKILTGKPEAPPFVLVTSALLYQIAPWLFELQAWQLALALNALGLRYPGKQPCAPSLHLGNVVDLCKAFSIGLIHKEKVLLPAASGLYISLLPGGPTQNNTRIVRMIFVKNETWSGLMTEERALSIPRLLTARHLPTDVRAAQTFIRTKKAPPGLSFDDKGIFLTANPVIRLDFRWYQLTASNVDIEQLFRDAYQILIGGGGPRTLKPGNEKRPFTDLMENFGFVGAMHRMVDIALREHTYPDHVVPIFDMNYVPVCNQLAALNIHTLTGRFTKHIIGFRNNQYDAQFLLTDVCSKSRRTGLIDRNRLNVSTIEAYPWITPGMERHFSPKDICLLLASVFVTMEVNRVGGCEDWGWSTLRVPLCRTDVEDLSGDDAPVVWPSVKEMYAIASESYVTNAMEAVCQFMHHHRTTDGPFIVYSDTGVIDRVTTHAVMCGRLTRETWFDGGKPTAIRLALKLSDYRRWIGKQSRSRECLVPNTPCPVRIRHTGEEAVLVVFDYVKDKYHVWKKTGHQGVMTELSRSDFDILEHTRCLPAQVRIKSTGDTAYAVREDGEGGWWIGPRADCDTVGLNRMRGDDFEWVTSAFYELNLLRPSGEEEDEGPEQIAELFTEDGEQKYRILQPDVPLPGRECQDWVMKEFFSEHSDYSVWRFVQWMEMKVTNAVLYESFYAVEQSLNESWAQRATLQVKESCRWLWDRLSASHPEHFKVSGYQRMVWFSKLTGREHDEETFEWIMQKLYEL
jgi:hypothetical protein